VVGIHVVARADRNEVAFVESQPSVSATENVVDLIRRQAAAFALVTLGLSDLEAD
jgi:hypothetical protein